MAWETDRTYKLTCEGCGRIGKQVEQSDDWNNHRTTFENFNSKLVGGWETDAANNGAFEIPICPDCGDKARVHLGVAHSASR